MLTCYRGRERLPQNALAYAAFRLSAQDTLAAVEMSAALEDDSETNLGYLGEVPFLEQCPLSVQLDLLADVWTRHRRRERFEASLLDAAVIYAACHTAARLSEFDPQWSAECLRCGPRHTSPGLIRGAPGRLRAMFDSFWDDYDFLLLEDLQDVAPDLANAIKGQLGLTDEFVQPLYEALGRAHPSPQLATNFGGLFTADEIQQALSLLQTSGRGKG